MYTKAMTLRQLLRQHGIRQSSELATRVGISRQSAHMLWQGKQGLSRQMIYRISEATGIAPAALFLAERPLPRPQRKGRPPKRRPEARQP
jgi:transcriptional regulator with XRE-family HTH domain